MDRRNLFKALFGAAAVVGGATLLGSRAAEAAVTGFAPGAPLAPTAAPAVATEADLAEARIENAQAVVVRRGGGRGRVVVRPNGRVVVRRPGRRVIIRRGPRGRTVIVRRPRRRRAIIVR